jgi:hypothetical protein
MHIDLKRNLSDFDSATLLRAFDARPRSVFCLAPRAPRFERGFSRQGVQRCTSGSKRVGVFHGLPHIVESKSDGKDRDQP